MRKSWLSKSHSLPHLTAVLLKNLERSSTTFTQVKILNAKIARLVRNANKLRDTLAFELVSHLLTNAAALAIALTIILVM